MPYNLSEKKDQKKFQLREKKRWQEKNNAIYCDLRQTDLTIPTNIDLKILERLAKIVRGFLFTAIEAAQSGHPGSSSKTEAILALILGNTIAFDPINPKNPGRDRIIWSAGHSTPLIYAVNSLIYENLRHIGRQFYPAVIHPIFPEDLLRFRQIDGLPGHAESHYPLIDYSTGPSGHGLSAAGGMAIAHQSSGLSTKIWVFMGDAESEEGITYEARNILATIKTKNITVVLDYNHFGIDGPIEEVISSNYLEHWRGLGWNIIEVNGHNFTELIAAYQLITTTGLPNNQPTVIISHTLKGKDYGEKENTIEAHGTPAKHEEYVKIIQKLGFDIPGIPNLIEKDIAVIAAAFTEKEKNFIVTQLEQGTQKIIPENKLVETMRQTLANRPLVNPLHIQRPTKLPSELIFNPGQAVATRVAAGIWCEWLMRQTTFCWIGAGDLSRSLNLQKAENVYGIINEHNPYGRGIRFGIAEQNMAMMSAGLSGDILPGGYQPLAIFGTFAVFTTMIGGCLRLAAINNHVNLEQQGFFIVLASHDGPETGEDGPTHQGLYWTGLYQALPGIKIYKPTDANETIEMLFGALKNGEPIIMSLSRYATSVWDRTQTADASSANDGAYVWQDYQNNHLPKKVLVISGPLLLENIATILPTLKKHFNVKIVAVTAPKIFTELQRQRPDQAEKILSEEEKKYTITLHNGDKKFLEDFITPQKINSRQWGVDIFLRSGKAMDVYATAGLSAPTLLEKILQDIK